MKVSRREALAFGAGVVGLAVAGRFSPAFATPDEAAAAIAEFTGGATPATGRVRLTAPEIAENGNSVPIAVAVDSPMTDIDRVEAVLIVADGNPRPGVAVFRFGPMSGAAEASTRMRLAGTQNVIAVAKMSDGSFYEDRKEVKVTIGGCGG